VLDDIIRLNGELDLIADNLTKLSRLRNNADYKTDKEFSIFFLKICFLNSYFLEHSIIFWTYFGLIDSSMLVIVIPI
jgi:hypothetical protein